MKTPRPYQEEAIQELIASLQSYKRIMNKAPTGSGKTFMVGEAMRRVLDNRHALFTTNRKHIVEQSIKAFAEDFPNVNIHCRTIQSLRVPWALDTLIKQCGGIHYLILDEASTCMNNSGMQIYYELNSTYDNPAANELKVIGLDATHERADDRAMGLFFEAIGFDIPIATLIEQGYRSKPKSMKIVGDVKDLDFVASTWLDNASEHKSIIFTRTIQNVDRLAEIMRALGVDASPHHSQLSKRQRNAALKSQVIISDSTLERGVDIKGVSCVIIASNPTSHSRYIQMAGRAVGRAGDNCLLIDIASPHDSLVQTSDVLMSKKKWDWLHGNEKRPRLFNVTTRFVNVF